MLVMLFACVAAAVCVQVLAFIVICGERALSIENVGRERLSNQDAGLDVLRREAVDRWAATEWRDLGDGRAGLTGRLTGIEGSEGWAMQAEVAEEAEAPRIRTTGWVERGRDGIDLPQAGIVAESIHAGAGRITPWLVCEQGSTAMAWCGRGVSEPAPVGPGCSVTAMSREWSLDEGWRAALTGKSLSGERVKVIDGSDGRLVSLAEELPQNGSDAPVVVAVLGGADVDARWLGDLYGVVMVDGGSILLDGTIVHGAVFASESVDFGLAGQVNFCRATLSWASDASLRRTRLVPGTRGEGTW